MVSVLWEHHLYTLQLVFCGLFPITCTFFLPSSSLHYQIRNTIKYITDSSQFVIPRLKPRSSFNAGWDNRACNPHLDILSYVRIPPLPPHPPSPYFTPHLPLMVTCFCPNKISDLQGWSDLKTQLLTPPMESNPTEPYPSSWISEMRKLRSPLLWTQSHQRFSLLQHVQTTSEYSFACCTNCQTANCQTPNLPSLL